MDIKISHVPHLNGNPTPARCNRRTGEIWINDSVWQSIPSEHRVFILLHEYGHIALDSSDELAVDAFAHKHYIEMGYSLNESVRALSRVLTGKSNQHVQRVQNQFNRSLEIDNKNNLNNMCKCNSEEKIGNKRESWFSGYDEDFGGCDAGKLRPRQYRKCVRAEGKAQKKVNNSEGNKALREGRGAGLAAKGEAKRLLGEQGIVGESEMGSAITKVGGMIMGKQDAGGSDTPPKSNTNKILIWVGVGVAVVGLAIVAIFIFKKKA